LISAPAGDSVTEPPLPQRRFGDGGGGSFAPVLQDFRMAATEV
jgi:hypothetical protein